MPFIILATAHSGEDVCFALSIPPGIPPGFLVSLAGLGLISGRLRTVAVFLDRAECRVRPRLNCRIVIVYRQLITLKGLVSYPS
jgi:hypothetical protein